MQKTTGHRLLDYLKPRLFDPLGIEGAEWEQSPEGYDCGGFGLSIKTEDIARFGQFLLQRGQWEGNQLLPASWVDLATRKHSDNSNTQTSPDWMAGYGYQFWRCVPDCYRGDGAFGQYCVVIPRLDMVIAITSGVDDMQAMLTPLWSSVLPCVGGENQGDTTSDAELASKLAGASYAPPAIVHGSSIEAANNGSTFLFDTNYEGYRKVAFSFSGDACNVAFAVGASDFRLSFGRERWQEGIYAAPVDYYVTPLMNLRVASSFTWEKENALFLTARDLRSPYVMTWRVVFDKDEVEIRHTVNVTFKSADIPAIKGKRV